MELDYKDGQTPLEEEEKHGLLIKSISTHGELNELEQLNIQKAVAWTLERKFKTQTILTEQFIKRVHQKMFGDVWVWAGKFRKSEKNIGVSWIKVAIELKYLLDNTQFWIENNTFPPDEIAIRFKHQLVSIHCFPNGNGRHSRLMADVLIESVFGENVFSWGYINMTAPNETRQKYILALRAADKGDVRGLIEFARG